MYLECISYILIQLVIVVLLYVDIQYKSSVYCRVGRIPLRPIAGLGEGAWGGPGGGGAPPPADREIHPGATHATGALIGPSFTKYARL